MPLLPRQEIPFSLLNEGEAELLLIARENDLYSRIASNKGDDAMAQAYANIANTYKNAVQTGHLRTNTTAQFSINGLVVAAVNNQINQSRRKTKPAINFAQNSSSTTALNSLEFDVTPEQRERCRIDSINTATQRLASSGKAFTQADVTNLSFEIFEECIRNKPIENIINAHLEDAGPVLLYSLMPRKYQFNDAVNNRRFDQNRWVQETARVTGLSQNLVQKIASNGTLNLLEKSPAQIEEDWRPHIEKYATQSTQSSNALNSLTLIAILSIISLIISILGSAVAFVRAIKSYRTNVYNSVPDVDKLPPAEEDFNGNGIADSSETIIQKLTTPNNFGLIASLGIAIIPQFFLEKNRIIPLAIGGVGAAYFGYQIANQEKRWLVNGEWLNAESMKAAGYVQYEGEWYNAQLVSQKSGIGFSEIVSAGIGLFKSIASAFAEIKSENGNDSSFFAGNEQSCTISLATGQCIPST